MQFIKPIVLSIFLLSLLTACDEKSDTPKAASKARQVRINNDSAGNVELLIGGASQLVIAPGKAKAKNITSDLQTISINNAGGKELFKQTVTIPKNSFARYTVRPDESVVATAGTINEPEIISTNKREIRLENAATFPVRVVANGMLLAVVEPGEGVRIDSGELENVWSFQRTNGNVLFEQSLIVPQNGTINYAVLEDGQVITTGEPIKPNIQFRTASLSGPLF